MPDVQKNKRLSSVKFGCINPLIKPIDCDDTGGLSNVDRAKDCHASLKVFAKLQNIKDEDCETILSDFLADAMHWARFAGLDFDDCLRRAEGHYEAELKGEL